MTPARKLQVFVVVATTAALGLAALSTLSRAAESSKPLGGESQRARQEAVSKGIEYLKSKGQAEDGSFSAAGGPAVTALVTTSILKNGRTAQDPVVEKALKYLQGFVQADGGIYQEGSRHRNYETCVGLMCFAAANADQKFDDVVKNAEEFLKKGQWDESQKVQPDNVAYGGAGYGQQERPDLSNTQFFLDALKAAGANADDEAVKKALVFVSRCQNLESSFNTTEFPAKNPDGGFYYTPAAGGRSLAGNTDNGGLRSYGSMTYAGLKSMIYCGLTADDPRVKAAVEWARKNYTLDANPGMGEAGLYYYYHSFAKAMAAMGKPEVTDAEGKSHAWREELIAAITSRQKPDGSWVNETSRWMEGDPNLVTGYALLALSYCGE